MLETIEIDHLLELVFRNYGHFQWKRVLGYFLVSGALSKILSIKKTEKNLGERI